MATELPNNVLVNGYRKLFNEPRSTGEAYGYWLFVIGAILGAVGIIVFIWSTTLERGTATFWSMRQLAVVFSSIGLPVMMAGVVFRLPVRRIVDRFATVGLAICIVAAVVFIWAYPGSWNVATGDLSPIIIGLYALGMGIIVLSALVLPVITETPAWADTATGIEETETATSSPESSSRASFDVYADRAGEYRWRLTHQNGNIIADSGEGYSSRDSAVEAVDRVRSYSVSADTLELEQGAFQVYKDRAGEFRWRLLSPNGRIIADSGEGYSSKGDANRSIDRIRSIEDYNFEIYEDRSEQYRWRLVASNNEIIADGGQGYSTERNCSSAVERVEKYIQSADTLELKDAAFEVYEDRAEQYRWRLFAPNGQIIADSGEGYASRSGVKNGIESVRKNTSEAPISAD